MTDEQLLLATAYVDGELPVSERARVESDPQMWAEVQRQRSVQQLAHAIPPYSQAIAQAQISAAIASAYGVASPTDDSAQPTPTQPNFAPRSGGAGGTVVQLSDRRRRGAWIGGSIAAGLMLAAAGIAILDSRDSTDGSASNDASAELAYDTTSDVATSMAESAADEGTFSDETYPAAPEAERPPISTTSDTVGASDVDSSGPLAFNDRGELVEVGRVLIAQAALSVLEPSASTCEVRSDRGDSLPVLADALYGKDDPQPVVIAVDLSTIADEQFVVYAADPLSCDVIMSAQGSFER